MRALLSILLCTAAVCADPPDLATLVDIPDPAARKQAAREMAKDPELNLETLVAATREFRPRKIDAEQRGVVRHEAALRVEGKTEQTTIVTYTPKSLDRSKPAALLLYLHGSGGRGEEAIGLWQNYAETLGMIIVAPTEAGPNGGYAFTKRERAASLAALRWARRQFDIDENRIHLTGVSRGGHMTWDVGTRHPDRWASLAPMIGGPRWLPQRGQNNLRFLKNIVDTPIRDLQGAKDHPEMLKSLRFAFAQLDELGARDAKLEIFPELGHSFRMEAVAWEKFLGAAERKSVPERVVRLTAGAKGEARAHWIEILSLHRDVKEKFTPRVDATKWEKSGKRMYMDSLVRKRTARIEARMVAQGHFEISSERVRGYRILLTAGMFDPAEPVSVTWNGRKRRVRVKPSARVLLEEFADRFDRTFLPVAEIRIP